MGASSHYRKVWTARNPLFLDHDQNTSMAAQPNKNFGDGSDTSRGQVPSGGGTGPAVSSANPAKSPLLPLLPGNMSTAPSTSYALRNRKVHPHPVNKNAKAHLTELQKLGYGNLSDVPVDYWEPKKPGESGGEHNARRQKECANMDQFISQEKKL